MTLEQRKKAIAGITKELQRLGYVRTKNSSTEVHFKRAIENSNDGDMIKLEKYYKSDGISYDYGVYAIRSLLHVSGPYTIIEFIPFTNEELQILDKYGCELPEGFARTANQNINDWFKAEDEVPIQKTVIKEFEKLGWTMDEDGDLIKGVERIYLYFHSMIANKHNVTSYTSIPFTNEELKILDRYGYELQPSHITLTGQSIGDWFKAEDNKSSVYTELETLGYESVSVTDYPTAKELYERRTQLADGEFLIDRIFFHWTKQTVARKQNINGSREAFQYVPFTNEELKILDKYDYTFSYYYKLHVKQEVSDWFKAEDKMTKVPIKRIVVEDPELLVKQRTMVIKEFEKLGWVTDINDNLRKDDRIIILSSFSRLYADKLDSRQFRHIPFTNEELQILDKYNYQLSRTHKEKTGQEISDWFKAEDWLKPINSKKQLKK